MKKSSLVKGANLLKKFVEKDRCEDSLTPRCKNDMLIRLTNPIIQIYWWYGIIVQSHWCQLASRGWILKNAHWCKVGVYVAEFWRTNLHIWFYGWSEIVLVLCLITNFLVFNVCIKCVVHECMAYTAKSVMHECTTLIALFLMLN